MPRRSSGRVFESTLGNLRFPESCEAYKGCAVISKPLVRLEIGAERLVFGVVPLCALDPLIPSDKSPYRSRVAEISPFGRNDKGDLSFRTDVRNLLVEQSLLSLGITFGKLW